ncbi:MAG TPA: YCF48-related protein [Bacteroidota bacterium]|nr:YCF48-related protein [Bacteroidota bacterium]
MVTFVRFLLALVLCSYGATAQWWYWQNPLPQGNTLTALHMFGSTDFLAVGDAGVILRTTNSGGSWRIRYQPLGLVRIHTVEFVDAQTGFVSGEDSQGAGQLLKTENGGETWVPVSVGTISPIYGIDFVSTLTGWAVGSGGLILKTTNGGSTWSKQPTGTTASLYAVSFSSSVEGIAVGEGGTVLSTIDGATWTETTPASVIFYGVKYVLDSWYAVGTGGTILRNGTPVSQTGTTQTLRAITVAGGTFVAVGDGGTIVRSLNGLSWTAVNSGTTNALRSVHFAGSNDGVAVGTNGEILRTSDSGVTWVRMRGGFSRNLTDIVSLASSLLAVGDSGQIVKTTNAGQLWLEKAGGVNAGLQGGAVTSGDTLVLVGAGGTILRSTDSGESWSRQSSSTSVNLFGVSFVGGMKGFAVGGSGTILRTMNGGMTWESKASNTTSTLRAIGIMDSSIAVAVGLLGVMRRTADGGETWSPVVYRDTALTLYTVVFPKPGVGLAAGAGVAPGLPPVLLRSIDSGKTWFAVNLVGVVASETIRAISFLNADTGYAVGTNGLILKTTNAGAAWERLQSYTSQTLTDIVYTPTGNGYLVGTNGTIMSTVSIEPSSVRKLPYASVGSFLLYQNYPNPFNPNTTISFSIPFSAHAKLTIFNLLGQEISTIFDGEALAERLITLPFDAGVLPSGVYYYRLQVGEFQKTRTMILVR